MRARAGSVAREDVSPIPEYGDETLAVRAKGKTVKEIVWRVGWRLEVVRKMSMIVVVNDEARKMG